MNRLKEEILSKKLKTSSGVGIVLILLCAWPFLPIQKHRFLKPYKKPISLGGYEIKPNIILDRIGKLAEMNIDAQFKYPADKMFEDGCVFSVEVYVENQTPQSYPIHAKTPEEQQGFRVENTRADSRNYKSGYSENQSLILSLYDEPMVRQEYVLKLKPRDVGGNNNCRDSKTISHKARHIRTSHFNKAMTRAFRY